MFTQLQKDYGYSEQDELTVFFEEPFWVGVFERIENGTNRSVKQEVERKKKLMKGDCLN